MRKRVKTKTSCLSLGKLPSALLKELLASLSISDAEIIIPPGVGRDAAGLKIGKRFFAVTTDPITFTTDQMVTYSLSVNINDICCLGCFPRWYTGTLLLPLGTREADVRQYWRELNTALKKYSIQSIGGHVEVTDAVSRPVLVGQLIGESKYQRLLNPENIRPKDCLLLWQSVAIEGTAIIARECKKKLKRYFSDYKINRMSSLLKNPGICVLPYVEKILPYRGVVALHDPTEGGIATAIHELADAVNCGVVVNYDQIPFLKETSQLADIFHFDPLGLIASGCLLIACRPTCAQALLNKFQESLRFVGMFTESSDRRMFKDNRCQLLPRFDKDEIIQVIS